MIKTRLKINKACSENWDKMNDDEKGKFCKICSKSVIDFTGQSPQEISLKIKQSKGEVCGRLTKSQLNTPILVFETYKAYKLPYSNKIAASLLLAASLSSLSAMSPNESKFELKMPYSSSLNIHNKFITDTASLKNDISEEQIKTISFKGKVEVSNLDIFGKEHNEYVGKAIQNVSIEVITLKKVYTTISDNKGFFEIKIPENILKENIVVSVNYSEARLSTAVPEDSYISFENEEIIVSKKEMNELLTIKAHKMVHYLGGLGFHSVTQKTKPIILINGYEISYIEYLRSTSNNKDKYSLKSKKSYYFFGEKAVALYGEKAKHGLYLYFDK